MLQLLARFGGLFVVFWEAFWAAPFATKHKEFKGFWSFWAAVLASLSGPFLEPFRGPFCTPKLSRARFARPEIRAKEQASGSKSKGFFFCSIPPIPRIWGRNRRGFLLLWYLLLGNLWYIVSNGFEMA